MLPLLIMAGMSALSALSAAKGAKDAAKPTQASKEQLAALAQQNQILGQQGQVLGQQGQSLSNQNRLFQAYINPDDIINKNLFAAESQQANSATQQQLSNLLAANRKSRLMGRQSFFNPEREDEAISQFMTRASDANANIARSNALGRILQAANNYGSGASGYGNMAGGYGTLAGGYGTNAAGYTDQIPVQQKQQQAQSSVMPALLGAGASAIGSYYGLGGNNSMSNIFSMLGNSGSSPWLNPDTGRYQ